ncbi:tyrosine-type recombinase/integrase [Dapis sp. BLCC M229]|uniref:tyrosine-type recombinase/integrase n=1 Tax=Dapis sp. BLCC M229 TaxID=3400188 RepID=UPI003CF1CBFC
MSLNKAHFLPRGIARLDSCEGRLRVRFPRKLFGKDKTLYLGLPDLPKYRAIAEVKVEAINTDIALGQFDFTLERYRPQQNKLLQMPSVDKLHHHKIEEAKSQISLVELWDKFYDYGLPKWKESTQVYLETTVRRWLEKATAEVKTADNAVELRSFLLSHTSESMAKRVLIWINAAFNWGLKQKLVFGNNPYEGMSNELKHNYQKKATPLAFTPAEKLAILENFAQHKGNWNGRGVTGKGYNHYLPLVKFWFLTGCRPSEGIGLTWGAVDSDYRFVVFAGGAVQLLSGRIVNTTSSKNNKVRRFPINEELRGLFMSIRPESAQPSDLVFPSLTGKVIAYNNFCHNAWRRMVCELVKKSTPYSCRDTFITEQLSKGVSATIIAKWCDTSVKMIESHYFDLNVINILPV